MNHGILIVAFLDALVALAVWGGMKWSGYAWRWPLVLAGVVGIQAVIVGLMMLGHRVGWDGRGHGGVTSMLPVIAAIVAANAFRSRKAAPAISGRRLGVVFALILALHVTVIGGLIALNHYRHL
jgi:hypothetical protein